MFQNKKQFEIRTPEDLWFATKETSQGFLQDFDQFGDSFREELEENSLRKLLSGISDVIFRKLEI